jgi:hypothetical protein
MPKMLEIPVLPVMPGVPVMPEIPVRHPTPGPDPAANVSARTPGDGMMRRTVRFPLAGAPPRTPTARPTEHARESPP